MVMPTSHVKPNSASSMQRENPLYNIESWTLMKTVLRALDECYTRMLHVVLNISKCAHVTNENLYAGTFRVSNKIAERKGEWDLQDTAKDTRSCKPVNCCNGSQHMGTCHEDAVTFVGVLKKDTGAHSRSLLAGCMKNRNHWMQRL